MTPGTAPVSRLTVFTTASVLVGLMALILPLISQQVMIQHVVVAGWIPAILGARVGWAAHRGAIHQRIVRKALPHDVSEERWAVQLVNPRVLTASGHPTKFQAYILLEVALTGLVWIAMVGPAVYPAFIRVTTVLGLGAEEFP